MILPFHHEDLRIWTLSVHNMQRDQIVTQFRCKPVNLEWYWGFVEVDKVSVYVGERSACKKISTVTKWSNEDTKNSTIPNITKKAIFSGNVPVPTEYHKSAQRRNPYYL